MRRRHLLRTAGAAVCASLAGCSVRGRTKHLHQYERTDREGETYWTFREDGEKLLNAGIEYAEQVNDGLVPVEFHTWHRDGTHLERFRIEIRFGRRAGKVPPDVYLDTFDSHPDPEIKFRDEPDRGATVLEVPDLGWVGVGSIDLSFLVRPHGWLPEEIGVGIREVVSEEGSFGMRYAAEVDDRIAFVREDDR